MSTEFRPCLLPGRKFLSLSLLFFLFSFRFQQQFCVPKCKGMRTRTSLLSVLNGTRSVISYGHYLQLTIIPYPMYSSIGNLLFYSGCFLSFFPSLFAHPFLSILSFSFSSQLVDKSLSCTRIYLNNTSVWQTLVSLLFLKYRLHRVSLTTVRCRVSLWKIVVSSSLTQRCVFPSSCPRQNASYSTVICTT